MAKLYEADLINSTHKERLSPKNSEPTHLTAASYETLGGPDASGASNADAYSINATAGVGTDTTIPKSVGAEPTHLTKVTEEDDAPELEFDTDDEFKTGDDLDAELDQFESTDPVDIDVKLGDDEDETTDVKKVAEELGAEPSNLPPAEQKKAPSLDEEDDTPFDDQEDDKLKEEDDTPFVKKDTSDEDDEKEKITEALKIRIKMPQTTLFESAGLSSKTQKKVGLVFEQVVRDTTQQIANQVHAHYKRLHEAKLARRDAIMAKQMDQYLTYVAEEWMKANQVAVRQSLRAELAENFMGALRKVFVEHYIDVPESKVDVVQKLTEDVVKLRKSLNEQVASKLKLRKLAEAANKARIVAESSRGLSVASITKLQKLAEDTPYTTAKDFREKVGLLKESYFPKAESKLTQKLEEDVQAPPAQSAKTVTADPDVDAIAQTLSRQAQTKW